MLKGIKKIKKSISGKQPSYEEEQMFFPALRVPPFYFFLAYIYHGKVHQRLCNILLTRSSRGHLWSLKPTTKAKKPQPQNHEVNF